MRKFVVIIVLVIFGLGTTSSALAGSHETPTKLVTVVTSPEPQTQLMAFVLTMQAVQQGHEAHILLCGPGGDIALKEPPESAVAPQAPMDMSPQGLMQQIMAEGATVQVCAIYLPNKGAEPDVLLDGITVAEPPAMAATMLDDHVRLFSF